MYFNFYTLRQSNLVIEKRFSRSKDDKLFVDRGRPTITPILCKTKLLQKLPSSVSNMYYELIFYMNGWVGSQSNLGSNCGSTNLSLTSSFISKFGFFNYIWCWKCWFVVVLDSEAFIPLYCNHGLNLLFIYFMNSWRHNMIIIVIT